MKNYQRLSDAEREEISRMLAQGCSFHGIAKQLGRWTSTISREVANGSCNKYTYRATKAQNRARRNARKRKAGKFRIDDNPDLKRYIYAKLMIFKDSILRHENQEATVMSTHIWRFSKNYGKIDKYVHIIKTL